MDGKCGIASILGAGQREARTSGNWDKCRTLRGENIFDLISNFPVKVGWVAGRYIRAQLNFYTFMKTYIFLGLEFLLNKRLVEHLGPLRVTMAVCPI